MPDQPMSPPTDRRQLLALSGAGLVASLAAPNLKSAMAQRAVQPRYASWIHGHSMVVETPDNIKREWKAGFHYFVEGWGNTTNWFHFAIPTPTVMNHERLRLDAVRLHFSTGSIDAIVRDVHVFDGSTRVVRHDGVQLTGEQNDVRLTVPGQPEVQWGVGVTLGVTFGPELESHEMRFIGAGAEFV